MRRKSETELLEIGRSLSVATNLTRGKNKIEVSPRRCYRVLGLNRQTALTTPDEKIKNQDLGLAKRAQTTPTTFGETDMERRRHGASRAKLLGCPHWPVSGSRQRTWLAAGPDLISGQQGAPSIRFQTGPQVVCNSSQAMCAGPASKLPRYLGPIKIPSSPTCTPYRSLMKDMSTQIGSHPSISLLLLSPGSRPVTTTNTRFCQREIYVAPFSPELYNPT
jgi:hypothetical protein